MLHLAGVGLRSLLVNTELYQKARQENMSFIYTRGDLPPGLGESDMTVGVHKNVALRLQLPDGAADGRL